ncbi:hypothetical protein Tco_1351113 [Tanacetum coccineum]
MESLRCNFFHGAEVSDRKMSYSKRVGNGEDNSLWEDVWMGDSTLKSYFPRGDIESAQYGELGNDVAHIQLVHLKDRWVWTLSCNGEFSVKYGSVKNHKKTIKNGQARTRESEEYKKKPKIQSRSQKN